MSVWGLQVQTPCADRGLEPDPGLTSLLLLMRLHAFSAAVLSCLLTAPVVRRAVAGTWSVYWNGLADGARPRPAAWTARAVQVTAGRLGRRERRTARPGARA